MYLFLSCMSWLCMFMSIMIMMPFLTLLERKIMSYIQNRKGPNKVSFLGLLQPVSDGLKLIMKESSFPYFSNFNLFILGAFLSFLIMVFSWSLIPSYFSFFFFNFSVLLLVMFSSFNIYSLLCTGLSSKKKYSLLGSMRGCSQVISYEVNLMFMILFPCFFYMSFSFYDFFDSLLLFLSFNLCMFFFWLMIILLETNRSPFDFAEGESELVSGFKTEYSSLVFAFLFLGEYGNMALLSLITSFFFFNFYLVPFLFFNFFFLWVRSSFPRFRYDMLMIFCWTFILPMIMSFLFLFFMFL